MPVLKTHQVSSNFRIFSPELYFFGYIIGTIFYLLQVLLGKPVTPYVTVPNYCIYNYCSSLHFLHHYQLKPHYFRVRGLVLWLRQLKMLTYVYEFKFRLFSEPWFNLCSSPNSIFLLKHTLGVCYAHCYAICVNEHLGKQLVMTQEVEIFTPMWKTLTSCFMVSSWPNSGCVGNGMTGSIR